MFSLCLHYKTVLNLPRSLTSHKKGETNLQGQTLLLILYTHFLTESDSVRLLWCAQISRVYKLNTSEVGSLGCNPCIQKNYMPHSWFCFKRHSKIFTILTAINWVIFFLIFLCVCLKSLSHICNFMPFWFGPFWNQLHWC